MSELERGCPLLADRIEAYLDGELEPAAATELEVHVRSCQACARELELARRVRTELRALPKLQAPAPVVHAVLARAREEADRSAPVGWPWLRPRRVALAVALILAVAATLIVMSSRGPEPGARLALDDPAVARATLETKLALAHVTRASGRVGRELGGDLLHDRLVRPLARSVAGSLDGGSGAPPNSAGASGTERG